MNRAHFTTAPVDIRKIHHLLLDGSNAQPGAVLFEDFKDCCSYYAGVKFDPEEDQCIHGKGMEWCDKDHCPLLAIEIGAAQ